MEFSLEGIKTAVCVQYYKGGVMVTQFKAKAICPKCKSTDQKYKHLVCGNNLPDLINKVCNKCGYHWLEYCADYVEPKEKK